MHVAPPDSKGVVLEVEVIFPVVIDHAVGVVVPTSTGADVELIPIRQGIVFCGTVLCGPVLCGPVLCGPGIVRCSHLDQIERTIKGRRQLLALHRLDSDAFSGQVETLQWIGRQPIRGVVFWQSHREVLHEPIAVVNPHEQAFALVGHRHDQVGRVNGELLQQRIENDWRDGAGQPP